MQLYTLRGSNVASQNKTLRPQKSFQGQTSLCSQRRYPLLAIRKNACSICGHLNCIALQFHSSDANVFISTDSLRSQVGTWPLVFYCVHTPLVCKRIFIKNKKDADLNSEVNFKHLVKQPLTQHRSYRPR